jgi:hypothetical protein
VEGEVPDVDAHAAGAVTWAVEAEVPDPGRADALCGKLRESALTR